MINRLSNVNRLTKDTILLITGTTGYIGTNLIRELTKYDYPILLTKNIDNKSYYFSNIENKKINIKLIKDKKIILVHMATFYSKNQMDSERIILSNEVFGQNLLKDLTDLELIKVIYINTMFNYYQDRTIRNLQYTKSKNKFSQFLKHKLSLQNIIFEEIFLDNIYGNYDIRKKVIPEIMNSIVNNQPNPIIDKKIFINLTHVNDVVKRIELAINSNSLSSTAFINKKMVSLSSVYNFLNSYKRDENLDSNLLEFSENKYIKNSPKIELNKISLEKLEYALINELKYYENRKFF
jgi:nucleoside-diphosphate-sugar epimerase